MLIDAMVDMVEMVYILNKYRQDYFVPSKWIYTEKSISHWYKLGSRQIDIRLVMHIVIAWKLENLCEVQNTACSKVMLYLLLVKDVEDVDLHV